MALLNSPPEKTPPVDWLRCYAAEFFGTFVLTFLDAGVAILHTAQPQNFSVAILSVTPGLVVLAMIFSLGELSGAHINPAVTLGFSLRGVFPWRRFPVYCLLQTAGALLAALSLKLLFGSMADAGSMHPQASGTLVFAFEMIPASLLIFVILATAHQSKIKGPEAAYPVAAMLVAANFMAKTISGASFNPARSLGPSLVTGNRLGLGIYLVAPLVGAWVAVGLVRLIHGPPKSADVFAAQGAKTVGDS